MNEETIHYTDEEKIKRLAAWHTQDMQEIEELKKENASLKAQQKPPKKNFLMGWGSVRRNQD